MLRLVRNKNIHNTLKQWKSIRSYTQLQSTSVAKSYLSNATRRHMSSSSGKTSETMFFAIGSGILAVTGGLVRILCISYYF